MPESMYNNRAELCGGPMGANNGFKLWRRLFEDNAGTGDIAEYAGIEALREFPRCGKLSEAVEHVDRWKTMIDTYGRGIPIPWLRVQILSMIPKDLIRDHERWRYGWCRTCEDHRMDSHEVHHPATRNNGRSCEEEFDEPSSKEGSCPSESLITSQ